MSIVQIGVYIGDTPNDPLFEFLQTQVPTRVAGSLKTKVVLVEPIREHFDQLTTNYRACRESISRTSPYLNTRAS